VGEGTTGSLDTSTQPLQFGGDGELDAADLRRLGEGLDVAWLRDPRYGGTVSGRFHVDGAGTDAAALSLAGTGRISHAELFGGVLSNADVSIDIHSGTLRASYSGAIRNLDPALPLADDRVRASLTGTATVRISVNELLTRTPEWQDYDIDGTAALEASMVRDVPIERVRVDAALRDSMLTIRQLDIGGAVIEGRASGALAVEKGHGSDFQFDVTQADLSRLAPLVGQDAGGVLTTKGRLTGPWDAIRLVGTGIVNRLRAPAVEAETFSGDYDLVLPSTGYIPEAGRVNAKATFAQVFGQTVNQATGTVTLARQELGFDLQVEQVAGRHGTVAGTLQLELERREIRLASLTLAVGQAPWRLSTESGTPAIAWSDHGVTTEPLVFLAGAGNDQRLSVSGSWLRDGTGAIRVNATHVFLETLSGAFERPARYAGVVDLDAMISGTRDAPRVAGTMTITNGRVRGLSYERLSSRVDYQNGMFTIDARLEASGSWLTAAGTVPLSLFDTKLPEREIKLTISSSTIQLGLIEGVTNVVRNVSGQVSLNVEVIGTSRDVHFSGTLEANNAAFLVAASGGRYKNGRVALRLARERITVDALHLEDTHGHPLDVVGSLGTHELQIGELEVDVKAHNFELLRNELGNAEVDATLQLRGNVDKPLLSGDVAMGTGNLKVDEIMQRLVYQPYATTAAKSPSEIDPMAALNPWDRLALNITLSVPENLRLTGQEIQVASGTPLGIGSINLRVGGDLAVLKDAGQPMAVYGSFDSMSGSFTFQGRVFQIQSGSSINFRGSGSPEMYVTVARTISGVQARVTVSGDLANPELQLASTPPLDSSDILSLIVFNTSMNNLSTTQQSELAVRAGTLAAGFVASPLMSAIQRGLGLETLQVEAAGQFSTGPKVTVGEEIAPGLVARFSRQFGTDEYNEAVIEYYLSRILQIRGTFSDAQSLTIRSPFTRVERAGIDLLLFFSF
jgi:translocation and assembly module TamB